MLDVVALIFITREIGRLAESKGLSSMRWKMYSILAWIAFELVGLMVAVNFFDKTDYFSLLLVGLIFAFTSYVIIKSILNKMPDYDFQDDIDQIGE